MFRCLKKNKREIKRGVKMKERTDEGCSDVGTWRQINDKTIKRQTGLEFIEFSQTMTESVAE